MTPSPEQMTRCDCPHPETCRRLEACLQERRIEEAGRPGWQHLLRVLLRRGPR